MRIEADGERESTDRPRQGWVNPPTEMKWLL